MTFIYDTGGWKVKKMVPEKEELLQKKGEKKVPEKKELLQANGVAPNLTINLKKKSLVKL